MKKILTVFITILVMALGTIPTAFADIQYVIEDTDSEFDGLTQIDDTGYYKYEFQGKEYCFYINDDNSRSIIKEFNQNEFDFFVIGLGTFSYIKACDYYMTASNSISSYQAHYTDAWKQSKGLISFYDMDFNLVSQYDTIEYITDFGYKNGRWYYTTIGGNSYFSSDTKTWEYEYVPDTISIFENDGIQYTNTSVSFDGENFYDVEFEKGFINIYSSTPPYIMRFGQLDDNIRYLSISEDNIYNIYLPIQSLLDTDTDMTIKNLYLIGNYLYIDTEEFYSSVSAKPENLKSARIKIALADIDVELEKMSAAPYVVYNNEILAFEEPPIIENGTTLIPIRFLFEQMGAEVDWEQDTRTATISKDSTVITFTIDNTTAMVNGEPAEMTLPAQLINDKTMVPVRFLSEELGYTVTWDGDNRIITIE